MLVCQQSETGGTKAPVFLYTHMMLLCGAVLPLRVYLIYQENSGFKAAASSSFCACASARSLPRVVK